MELVRENLNEKLYYKKLESGLEVYVLPKPYFASIMYSLKMGM